MVAVLVVVVVLQHTHFTANRVLHASSVVVVVVVVVDGGGGGDGGSVTIYSFHCEPCLTRKLSGGGGGGD